MISGIVVISGIIVMSKRPKNINDVRAVMKIPTKALPRFPPTSKSATKTQMTDHIPKNIAKSTKMLLKRANTITPAIE